MSERIARLGQEITLLKMRAHCVRLPPPLGEVFVPPQQHAKRCVTDRAGHDDVVARLGGRALHHLAVRYRAEGRNRYRSETRRAVGVAAQKRTIVALDIRARATGKYRKPSFVDCDRE